MGGAGSSRRAPGGFSRLSAVAEGAPAPHWRLSSRGAGAAAPLPLLPPPPPPAAGGRSLSPAPCSSCSCSTWSGSPQAPVTAAAPAPGRRCLAACAAGKEAGGGKPCPTGDRPPGEDKTLTVKPPPPLRPLLLLPVWKWEPGNAEEASKGQGSRQRRRQLCPSPLPVILPR